MQNNKNEILWEIIVLLNMKIVTISHIKLPHDNRYNSISISIIILNREIRVKITTYSF